MSSSHACRVTIWAPSAPGNPCVSSACSTNSTSGLYIPTALARSSSAASGARGTSMCPPVSELGQRTAEKPTDALKEANAGLSYAGRILLSAINLDHGIDADAEERQNDPTRERQHGIVQQAEEDRSYGSSSCKPDERGLPPEPLNGKGRSVFAGNGGDNDDRGEQEGHCIGVALLN